MREARWFDFCLVTTHSIVVNDSIGHDIKKAQA